MYNDRFVRGYMAAILAVLLFSVTFRVVSEMIQELESPRDVSALVLRRIHERDQKEARSDK